MADDSTHPSLPAAVDRGTFQAELDRLRAREKAHTREGEPIAAARRGLPMVEVDANLALIGPDGPLTLLEVFEGRRQLIAYYFMRQTGYPAAEQCEGYTWVTTQVSELSYLHSRDITFAVLCQGPYDESTRYRDFMGWTMPWYSAQASLNSLLVGSPNEPHDHQAHPRHGRHHRRVRDPHRRTGQRRARSAKSQRTDPAPQLNTIDALIRIPATAIIAVERTWGRYQHRLALGHACLGRPDDALQHALKATKHLQRVGNDDIRLAAALDMLATCHQDLGQLDDAAQTRQRSVDLFAIAAPRSAECVAALVKLGDLCRFQGHYDLRRALPGR